MRIFGQFAFAAALLWPALALAAEPSGCDKLKWPLERERAALSAPGIASIASGAPLAYDTAAKLRLAPQGEAALVKPPERAPKNAPSWAGTTTLAAPAAAGTFKVTVSDAAWIDVVQDGRFVKPTGFAGAKDCPGLSKSVKFPLAAAPLTIQLSDVKSPDIAVIVSPE